LKYSAATVLALGLAACQQSPSRNSAETQAKVIKVVVARATEETNDFEPQIDQFEASKRAKRQSLKGCAVAAISTEQDMNGLNVRSGPSKDSPVIGVLQSLVETDPHSPVDPPLPEDKAFGPSFTITAIQGQWLKIADISPTTEGFDPTLRKRATKRNYQGSGWIHRSRVAVDPGFHDNAYDKPYFEPGKWTSIDDGAGELLTLTGGKQGYTAELLSCKLNWLQIRYQDKATDGQTRPATGWFHMSPNYIGRKSCATGDADCRIRQDMDIWDGPN
jgi:hypothetical protein